MIDYYCQALQAHYSIRKECLRCELTHNYCYRKGYCCISNSAIERRASDTMQHSEMYRNSARAIPKVN
jgi:hypothetical protein